MGAGTKANYSKIGLAVVAGVAATIGALVYFGGLGDRQAKLMAETCCETGATGLSIGSDVNFRGVKVGSVSDITFVGREYAGTDEKEAQRILVKMALSARMFTPRDGSSPDVVLKRFVKHGLRATVSSSGITGISRIELDYPKVPVPETRLPWRPRSIYIPPAPSILESFSDSATHVMSQLNSMDFKSTWSNVNDLVSNAREVAQNVNAIVDSQKSTINSAMGEIESAAFQLRELATELRENPSLLLRERDTAPLPETR